MAYSLLISPIGLVSRMIETHLFCTETMFKKNNEVVPRSSTLQFQNSANSIFYGLILILTFKRDRVDWFFLFDVWCLFCLSVYGLDPKCRLWSEIRSEHPSLSAKRSIRFSSCRFLSGLCFLGIVNTCLTLSFFPTSDLLTLQPQVQMNVNNYW